MTQSQTVRYRTFGCDLFMCATMFHKAVHSVASSTEVLVENVSSEVSTPERPGVADRHARRKLLLKRSPFVICSVLILVVGIICAVRLEYRNSLKEYRSSAHCNNSAVAF